MKTEELEERLKMKAIVYQKGNSPDCLVLREVEKPFPHDNEVLVKIIAVSVNAADYHSMKMGIVPKHKIFGSDISGQVEAVGKNIRHFAVGDEVFGDISACGFGGFAEYAAVSEIPLALKPAGVSFEAAAAVPMAAVTALQALRNAGNIQLGQKVLICGAGGGVGTFAVQLAKYLGAKVTAICSTRNVELMRSLGADYVVDYTHEDYLKSSNRHDLILAVNGRQPLSAYKRALSPSGTAVIVGGALSQVIKSLLLGPILSLGGRKVCVLIAKPNAIDLEFIIKLVEAGKIKPVIERRYPLSETAEAMRYLSGGHARGKVVISV
jgi:NADPH:quinone reductase-like Zn-dependent oxidoreductase